MSERRRPLITAIMVTLSRLIPMPLLSWWIYESHSGANIDKAQVWWALVVCTIIGCTDFVDGYLARKHGPTVLGGLMDPIADKVFIAVGFLPYADRGWVPWWLVAALFLREFLVTALRSSFDNSTNATAGATIPKLLGRDKPPVKPVAVARMPDPPPPKGLEVEVIRGKERTAEKLDR